MLIALLVPLALAVLLFSFVLVRSARSGSALLPKLEAIIVGAIVSFFDTLGIGSFAPTAAWLKFRRLVPDGFIPQTMLVGLTPPSIAEAIIFLVLLGVLVDPVAPGRLRVWRCCWADWSAPRWSPGRGSGSSSWSLRLPWCIAAVAYTMTNLHLFPGGGTASSLPLSLMIIAIAANFAFGILLNFGVGNFAPSLVMFSLMGMDPRYAFPIMAGGAALMGAAASTRHIQIGKIDLQDRARPGNRRHSGGPGGSAYRQIDAGRDAALARDRRRALRSCGHVPRGVARKTRAPSGGRHRSRPRVREPFQRQTIVAPGGRANGGRIVMRSHPALADRRSHPDHPPHRRFAPIISERSSKGGRPDCRRFVSTPLERAN